MSKKKKASVKQGKEHKIERRRSAPKTERPKQNKDDLFGFVARQFEIVGDIQSPIPDWAHWRPAKNL
jgi:hypothetical protein